MKNHLKLLFYIYVISFYSGQEALARTEEIKVAKFQIKKLERALLEFKKDIRRFPATIDGLASLYKNNYQLENWHGPYSNRPYLYIDSWENNYIYFYPAKYGNSEYDLYSIGPNRIDEQGLGDDITNW